jgi:malic enzyme
MESIKNKNTEYETLVREHLGLFKMEVKINVRDSRGLALVYTPGVAASCLEIKKNNDLAYKYTNKMNSMFVVTDSSGFKEVIEGKNWNNMAPIPYLESICVYYKTVANIDAYPIVIDYTKIKSEEELLETINAITPAYSAVEFFKMCPDRLKGFYELAKDQKGYAVLDSNKKRELDEKLKSANKALTANAIYAAVLRATLDTQAYFNINSIIEHVTESYFHRENKSDFYFEFETVLKEATEYILNNNLFFNNKEYNLNKEELSVNYVINKFKNYLIFGEDAWIDRFPKNYVSSQKTNDVNSLLLHERYKGVVKTGCKVQMRDINILNSIQIWSSIDSISAELLERPEDASILTCRSNLGAIITNGTAILGLGNIGALAGLPVMEGKSVLFKLFGGTDIVPLCVSTTDPDKFTEIVSRITPIFSSINLEDIKAPDCFKIENSLNDMTDYPVFHDDQHGTAVVVLAGLINALKLKNKSIKDVKIVMNGAGAAGLSVTELILKYGATNYIVCDTEGAIYEGRQKNMNEFKNIIAGKTNFTKEKGKLAEVLKNADVFIGVSAPKVLTGNLIKSMNKDPIIFALANPTPEILPNEATEAGAYVVATGRSDFPNQINNSLAFPGIFRAAMDVRAKNITIEMKIAAAVAISNLVSPHRLSPLYIVPESLDTSVSIEVCKAVADVAFKNKENRDKIFTAELVAENINTWFMEGKLLKLDDVITKKVWQDIDNYDLLKK